MTTFLHLGLTALAALAPCTVAQQPEAPVFDADLGTDLNLGNDQTVVVNLPFTYAYPGAAASAQISICSNGFVALRADTSAPALPSVAALQSGPPRIAPLWIDLDPATRATVGSGVYFRAQASPARAVITWNRVPVFGTSRLMTVQLQLLGDGSYCVHYGDGVMPNGFTVVGSTPGGGAALRPVDLSSTESRHLIVAAPVTLYDTLATDTEFDLNGRDLMVAPDGVGGLRVMTRRQADALIVADHAATPAISGPGWYDPARQVVVFDGQEFDGRWYRPTATLRQAHNPDATVVGVANHGFDGDGLFATWSSARQTLDFWRRSRERWQALGALIPGAMREVAMAAVPFGDLAVVAANTSSPVQVYAYASTPSPRMVLSATPFAPTAGLARFVCKPPSAPPFPHLVMLVQTASGVQHWDLRNGASSLEWRQSAIATPPAAMPMALDPQRNRIVCSNGATTFEFDGSRWTQIAVASPPAARTAHTLVYDAARQHVWMIGGFVGGNTTASGDAWSWHGTHWSPRAFASPRYPARADAMVAYHPNLGAVLTGGFGAGGAGLADTYVWDGYGWSNETASLGSPGARGSASMEYLASINGLVLFGGVTAASRVLADTRVLIQGQSWQPHATAVTPPPRLNHVMVRDTLRDRVIMFGGHDLRTQYNDTWELSAVRGQLDWRVLAPPVSPAVRDIHAMAFDALRGKVVLFGGRGARDAILADTWEFDPQVGTWQNVTPTTESPPGRWNATMVYDPTRARCVLFGGGRGFGGLLADVWEWDGSRWTSRDPGVLAANPAWNVAACWQPYDRRILLAGGHRDYAGTLIDSSLEIFADEDATAFRPSSRPLQIAQVPSAAGFNTTLLGKVYAPTGGVAFLGLGARSGPYLPLSPPLLCEPSYLELQPLAQLPITVSSPSWFALPIPSTVALRDLVVTVQAFVSDGPCLRATEARAILPRP